MMKTGVTSEDWGTSMIWHSASVSPCQKVNSLPAGRGCGWDRELFHRFIRQKPHSGGGINLTSEINCLFSSLCMEPGRSSSCQPAELSEVTDHQPHRPNLVARSNLLDRMPGTFVLPEGVGALGRSRDKLGQERRESRPALELPREMSTDVPCVGVPSRGARRRQGETHICVNTHTHTHVQHAHTQGQVSCGSDDKSDTCITQKSHRETGRNGGRAL